MIAYCIHPQESEDGRNSARRALDFARERGDTCSLVYSGDELRATVAAAEAADRGEDVVVVGSIQAVQAPASAAGFTSAEWRECWLACLSESGVAFVSVGGEAPTISPAAALAVSACKRAAEHLERALGRARGNLRMEARASTTGYTCGRPPYGYEAKGGSLVPITAQVTAVREIFARLRDGKTVPEIIEYLKDRFKGGGVIKNKDQHWDRVKVKRILSHTQLYCRGVYRTGALRVKIPTLAVLPPDWLDTPKLAQKAKRKRA
jgi:hypothetical protein